MSITPLSPNASAKGKIKHGSLLNENLCLSRVNSQWKSTSGGEGDQKKPLPRKLTPGTRLIRDWHGVGHTVIVLEDGFEYDGKHWKSLTAIAKTITGNQWNGPLFFGLAERKKKP